MKNETESKLPNYRIYDRTGVGVTQDIHAESLDDAIEQGREWIESGDWSRCSGEDSGEGRVYKLGIDLDCSVREIAHRTPRPELDGTEDSWVRDVLRLDCAPESIRDVSYADMDREQLTSLADYLADDDGSLSEEDMEFSSDIADQIRAALDEEDEDITDDSDEHDCSGTYSDTLPDCEMSECEGAADVDGDRDDEGHIWRQPYSVVGGIKENPGEWGGSGTNSRSLYVCRLCGCYRDESRTGSQRNPDEARGTVTIKDRDEDSEAWLKRTHEEDDFIPAWLAEMIDCPPTVRMTEEQAREWVEEHDDSDDLDEEELEHAFAAIFNRSADDEDRREGLWSHLCASAE